MKSWPLAKPGSDRIGSDRTGPDRTGPDRIGSDRQNPDWFNIKIPANRHMKSLGHQLRLLHTFTGVLPGKVRTRVSFNKIITNYTSEESLVNVVYDKYTALASFSFGKC